MLHKQINMVSILLAEMQPCPILAEGGERQTATLCAGFLQTLTV